MTMPNHASYWLKPVLYYLVECRINGNEYTYQIDPSPPYDMQRNLHPRPVTSTREAEQRVREMFTCPVTIIRSYGVYRQADGNERPRIIQYVGR